MKIQNNSIKNLNEIKDNLKSNCLQKINRSIYGVYFICCIGNYLQIIEEQLNLLLNSGLFEKTTKIFCFITLFDSNDTQLLNLFSRYYSKFEFFSTNENLYEKYAFNNFKKTLPNEPFYLYYIHTKGVSKPDCYIIEHRRSILNYYTIIKHEISIKLLNYYDVVGVTKFKYPKIHFSGNFWWTKSEHLFSLPDKISDSYLAPEMYICSNWYGKYVGLSNENEVFNNISIQNHINLSDENIINNIYEECLVNEWGKDVPI